MLKYKIILLFLFAAATNLAAQVPGYMGKRLLLSANIGPCLILPFSPDGIYYAGNDDYSGWKIRPRFGGTIDYVISRKTSIGVKYSYVQTGIKATQYYNYYDPWFGETSVKADVTAPALVKCHSIGVRFSGYGRRGNIPAPMGSFLGYQLGVGFSQFIDTEASFLRPSGDKSKGVYLTTVHPDVIFFWGVRRGIGKRMMWSVQCELNFAYLGYWIGSFNWDEKNNLDSVSGTDEAGKTQYLISKSNARSAYFNSNLFNLTLELSFLPK